LPADLQWLGRVGDVAAIIERADSTMSVHAAVGDNMLRRKWLTEVSDCNAPPIVHPSAVVSSTAQLSRGVFVGPGAVINARATIGPGVIVNSGAIVEHDCRVGAFSHLAPRSALGGAVVVGEACLIGIGAAVRPATRIGRDVTVGAAAAVIADLGDGVTAVGVPARAMDPV
jgi:sugar O-acyltransferase (sialic acid O-acetyltransferase NeuD family)